jgi:hypothetical protein
MWEGRAIDTAYVHSRRLGKWERGYRRKEKGGRGGTNGKEDVAQLMTARGDLMGRASALAVRWSFLTLLSVSMARCCAKKERRGH